ncbi:MAG: hypothetical protein ACE5G6_03065 [Terriglobia bacterium]
MAPPLSAVDAISPAFGQTKRQLFQPFRLGHWLRLAVVGLLTGEFAGGWSGSGNFSPPSQTTGEDDWGLAFLGLADPTPEKVLAFLPWILAAVVLLLTLGLIAIYIASVFRFILFDTVLTGRCRLREGWRRWREAGSRFFLWQVGFGLAVLAALGVVVGAPLYFAWRAGLLEKADANAGLLILGGVVLFFLVIGLVLFALVVDLFARDFLVPVMALESLGALAAWRRLLPLLGAEKMSYAGFVLMKIVLAIGSAILFGIVDVIVLLVLLIPLGIVAFVVVVAAASAGLTWNLYTIAVAVLVGLVGLLFLFYIVLFVYVPGLVFFQSYALRFFGGRYPLLGSMLERFSPPAPGSAPTPAPAA